MSEPEQPTALDPDMIMHADNPMPRRTILAGIAAALVAPPPVAACEPRSYNGDKMTQTKTCALAGRHAQIPMTTRLGPVRIAVTSEKLALPVWRDLVGLTVISHNQDVITLGVGNTVLVELVPCALRSVVPRTAGLYHVALHVPARGDLAIVIARLRHANYRHSAVDHLISEACYLWDADGNGIEITYETPWRGRLNPDVDNGFATNALAFDVNGNPHSAREPLDLYSILGEIRSGTDLDGKLSKESFVGHLHLTVGEIDRAMYFYADLLGFKQMISSNKVGFGDVAVDYSPHIVAFNMWQGPSVSQPPAGAAGLRRFIIHTPSAADVSAVASRLEAARYPIRLVGEALETHDPAGNAIRITTFPV